MDIIRFAIQNPVKVAVGVILIVLFGLIGLYAIPVQLTPNVDATVITVSTDWTGRSPEEIEREIIEPQEDVLKNLRNLRKMEATANQGESEIELEFFVGTDITEARIQVSDSLREVADYPDDVDEPVITTGEAGAGSPIAWLLLSSEHDSFDVQKLGDLATERIKPSLERTPGVSEVRVYGGREREVHVDFDPRAISQRQITFSELRDALRFENTNVSAGEFEEGKYDVRIRTIGQYEALDQIRETVVKYDEGGPIRLGDIAKVSLGYQKRRSFVRSRGQLALAFPVYKESGANVISVMESLRERIDGVNEQVLPRISQQVQIDDRLAVAPELELRHVYDETDYIYDALGLVQSNLVIGGSLAALVLLIFLRSVRPTMVVALAIPISVIGTFVVMAGFGRNINVISLAGLAFAVGMVVDNAIVVLENIDRHLSMGKTPLVAAYDGTKEVWGAILASTLTTLAVFVPVLTVQEEAGQLFRDIAIAICAAVTLSLVVSVTVIPAASSRFLRSKKAKEGAAVRAVHALFGLRKIADAVTRGFASVIYMLTDRAPGGVLMRLVIVGLLTAASLGGAIALMPAVDYLPRGNKNLVFGIILNPPGYNITQSESIAQVVEGVVRPFWEAETYEETAAAPEVIHPWTQQPIKGVPPIKNYFFVTFNGGVFNGATSGDKETVAPLSGLLSAASSQVPGSIGFAQQASIFGRGASGSRSIDVEVVGSDLETVRSAAVKLLDELRGAYGPFNIQPTPISFDKSAREVQIEADRVRAADLNMNVANLGNGIAALTDGIVVGDYRFRGEMIDIRARRDPAVQMTPEQLLQMPMAYVDREGNRGWVPLSAVTKVRRADAPQQVLRIEEQRAVKLQVTPPDAVPLEAATEAIRGMVADLRAKGDIALGVDVHLTGSASKLEAVREAMLGSWHGFTWESVKSIGISRIFLALLVTYLLMAALFESYLYPFVIMFSVPLAAVGGFIGLHLVGLYTPSQQLDTLTMLGFVILIGVVVNNAILLVHQALNFMRGVGEGEGDTTGRLAPRDAIRESVRTRIRPIFMTTCTSVAGMLPLVLMPGSGSELYKGLGSVVIGGLTLSTIFTLIVVPLLFSLVLDAKTLLYKTMRWDADAVVA